MNKLREFENEIGNVKPINIIKSKQRLLCLTVNNLRDDDKDESVKVLKKKNKLKRKNKQAKDEQKILKRQKLK
jgi:hypothetical protein